MPAPSLKSVTFFGPQEVQEQSQLRGKLVEERAIRGELFHHGLAKIHQTTTL